MTYQEVHDEVNELIKYAVLELREDHEGDALEDEVRERLWQDIDGHEWVIYYHHAKELSRAVGQYDAFDTWDLTGERFNDWSQVGFANMYHVFEEIDLEEAIKYTLEDNKNY